MHDDSARSGSLCPASRSPPALFGLGIGQAVLQQHADAQGSSVQAPVFEVDPLWPKPLPNNWLLGWTIGVWVDEQDHVWIIHRGAGGAAQQRARRRAQSADRRVLPHRPADPGLRSGWQSGALVGRSGRGLRVAAVQPRHPCRLQGQRLDRRQRREGRADPQVHQGRQVPDAGRPLRRQQGQQRSGEFRPRRQDLGRSEDQRGLYRRRLPQQARRRDRRRHRQDEALLGRLRQQAGRHQSRPVRSQARRRRSSSAIRCTASSARTTASSMSATGRTTGCRSSRRTATS